MTEFSTIHQRLFLSRVTKFSRVCGPCYEREGEETGFSASRNQHRGPVVGCAI